VDIDPPSDVEEPHADTFPLDGTPWRLTDHAGPAGDLVPVPDDVTATAVFADGRVSGSTGCNRYSGACLATDDRILVTRLAMTMMACGLSETAVERAFTAALEAAATYAIDGDRLEMRAPDGRVSLRLRAVRPPNLIGTHWTATMINNGRGGVASLIEGTEVDAVFGDDGRDSGSGGCNRYSGPYALDGAGLTVGTLAASMKACVAPDGIEEQEASYFAALARVAMWSVEDDRLRLRAGDGALQVEFRTPTSD
jgi:heat shock protein HslJ